MEHAYVAQKTKAEPTSVSEKGASPQRAYSTGSLTRIPQWANFAYGNQVPPSLRLPTAQLPTLDGTNSETMSITGDHLGIGNQLALEAVPREMGSLQARFEPTQNKENTTGMPDTLKVGIETLSGISMDDVHVHYNSSKPAELQALAYTQGTEIHVRPGQEQHLAHEAWHVVQQKQGRVKPTLQTKEATINDDAQLEKEADTMGTAAARQSVQPFAKKDARPLSGSVVQRQLDHTNQPNVGFHGDLDAANRVSEAWMLTDGSLNGSNPFQDPPGYNYIQQLKLTNFWIRFHLVNNLAGGPGTADNLVPASKRDNSRYESMVEKDLKDSVDEVRKGPRYDLVFFGVEVSYGTTPQGTAPQQSNAPYFPTQITYYQESRDKKKGWKWDVNGGTFNFVDPQPTDFGATIKLSAITKDQLRQQVYNYSWTDQDVGFLRSLAGTGAKKADFVKLIDDYSELGPEESATSALEVIQFGMIPFGERLGNDQAVKALGDAIGQGFVVID
jgi:hypothetical protein